MTHIIESKETLDIKKQIYVLKRKLEKTDYLAIKYSEHLITEQDYLPIKQQRQHYRDEINRLQELL